MSKRMLVTSTDLMMIQFLVPHVKYLSAHGWEIEVACSQVGGRLEEVRTALQGTAQVHQVRLYRNPAKPGNLRGYRDLRELMQSGRWDVVWTNEPVMGVMTRLAARAARRNGTKVVYMVHGFHFYQGAPKLNWMVYYPIERVMSRFTDMIVTINHEDYERARNMHAKDVKYIHGIGVDTGRLHRNEASGGDIGLRNQESAGSDIGLRNQESAGSDISLRNQENPGSDTGSQKQESLCDIRAEIGVGADAFLVLSVGELNKNKNHRVIIKALGRLKDKDIHYVICGKGDELANLKELAADEGIGEAVHFMGYRKDVVDIYGQADVFAFPSKREGLGLAALEAMFGGLPLVTSEMRGSKDYMEKGVTGFMCAADDDAGFADAILRLKQDVSLRRRCGENSRQAVIPYCLENVQKKVYGVFEELSE